MAECKVLYWGAIEEYYYQTWDELCCYTYPSQSYDQFVTGIEAVYDSYCIKDRVFADYVTQLFNNCLSGGSSGSSGAMSFTVEGDNGTPFTIVSGDTLEFVGQTGIDIGVADPEVRIAMDYNGADSFIMAATNGTSITVDGANDKLVIYDNDASLVKYINANQISSTSYWSAGTDGTSITPSGGTTNTDIKLNAGLTAQTLNISGNTGLGDNAKIMLGAGNDLEIYSDSSNGRIAVGSGTLQVEGDTLDFTDGGATSYLLRGVAAGAVSLYHSGNKKIETTSTGINVSGNTLVKNELGVSGRTYLGTIDAAGASYSADKILVAQGDGEVEYLTTAQLKADIGDADYWTGNTDGTSITPSGGTTNTDIKLNGGLTAQTINSSGNTHIGGQLFVSGTGENYIGGDLNMIDSDIVIENSHMIRFENSVGTEFGNILMNSANNMIFQNSRTGSDVLIRAGGSGSGDTIFSTAQSGDDTVLFALRGDTARVEMSADTFVRNNIGVSGKTFLGGTSSSSPTPTSSEKLLVLEDTGQVNTITKAQLTGFTENYWSANTYDSSISPSGSNVTTGVRISGDTHIKRTLGTTGDTYVAGDVYTDQVRRFTDNPTTTKINLSSGNVIKLFAGNSSNERMKISSSDIFISGDTTMATSTIHEDLTVNGTVGITGTTSQSGDFYMTGTNSIYFTENQVLGMRSTVTSGGNKLWVGYDDKIQNIIISRSADTLTSFYGPTSLKSTNDFACGISGNTNINGVLSGLTDARFGGNLGVSGKTFLGVLAAAGDGYSNDKILVQQSTGEVEYLTAAQLANSVVYWSANTDGSISPSGLTKNVGIGTTTPAGLFEVKDLIKFPGSNGDTFVGPSAGANWESGSQSNTAIGKLAMGLGTMNTALQNTAVGFASLSYLTTGDLNTAVGIQANQSLDTGSYNTSLGATAMFQGTYHSYNTALGASAMYFTTSGAAGKTVEVNTNNVAVGYKALYYNLDGAYNTSVGSRSLNNDSVTTAGTGNTAMGYASLSSNTTGSFNTTLGYLAGDANTSGDYNIIIGSGQDAPSATADYQMNIGGIIYGADVGSSSSINSVGIGTTTPTVKLDVNGDVKISGDTFVKGNLGVTGRTSVSTIVVANNLNISGTTRLIDDSKILLGAGEDTQIYQSGSETIIKDSSTGNIKIRAGTVTIQNGAASKTMGVFNGANSVDLNYNGNTKFQTSVNGINVTGWVQASTDVNVSGNTYISGTLSAMGNTTLSGGLGVGTAAPTTAGLIRATNDVVAYYSSDKRLKDNVTPITNALDKLDKINGVEFDWIPKEGIHENEGHDVGVIAQEVEEIIPEIVQTRNNGYKAVRYEKLVPILIESIKELKKEIEELKSK